MNIVIFASGSGTNAEQLIKHFSSNKTINVTGVLSNKTDAYVLERAKDHGIPSQTFTNEAFQQPQFLSVLESFQPDFIILAGFLRKIPNYLLTYYQDKIINIHPSLLPRYGGKGMYGSHVHQAVIDHREKQSGITIHLVNENYDEGRILFQSSCEVAPDDTPDTLATKIHELEHRYFPGVVEDYIAEYASKN